MHDGRSGELAIGHIKGVWRDLGREAGTRTVGMRRIEVAAGYFSTPAHEHGADEEIFFVLGGEGLLWQDGETYTVAQRTIASCIDLNAVRTRCGAARTGWTCSSSASGSTRG